MHPFYKAKLKNRATITLILTAGTSFYNFVETYSQTMSALSLIVSVYFTILVLKVIENPEEYSEDV